MSSGIDTLGLGLDAIVETDYRSDGDSGSGADGGSSSTTRRRASRAPPYPEAGNGSDGGSRAAAADTHIAVTTRIGVVRGVRRGQPMAAAERTPVFDSTPSQPLQGGGSGNESSSSSSSDSSGNRLYATAGSKNMARRRAKDPWEELEKRKAREARRAGRVHGSKVYRDAVKRAAMAGGESKRPRSKEARSAIEKLGRAQVVLAATVAPVSRKASSAEAKAREARSALSGLAIHARTQRRRRSIADGITPEVSDEEAVGTLGGDEAGSDNESDYSFDSIEPDTIARHDEAEEAAASHRELAALAAAAHADETAPAASTSPGSSLRNRLLARGARRRASATASTASAGSRPQSPADVGVPSLLQILSPGAVHHKVLKKHNQWATAAGAMRSAGRGESKAQSGVSSALAAMRRGRNVGRTGALASRFSAASLERADMLNTTAVQDEFGGPGRVPKRADSLRRIHTVRSVTTGADELMEEAALAAASHPPGFAAQPRASSSSLRKYRTPRHSSYRSPHARARHADAQLQFREVRMVLSFVDQATVVSARAVSKAWLRAASGNSLWWQFHDDNFPLQQCQPGMSWLDSYIAVAQWTAAREGRFSERGIGCQRRMFAAGSVADARPCSALTVHYVRRAAVPETVLKRRRGRRHRRPSVDQATTAFEGAPVHRTADDAVSEGPEEPPVPFIVVAGNGWMNVHRGDDSAELVASGSLPEVGPIRLVSSVGGSVVASCGESHVASVNVFTGHFNDGVTFDFKWAAHRGRMDAMSAIGGRSPERVASPEPGAASLAFYRPPRYLATAGKDMIVRIWDSQKLFNCVAILRQPELSGRVALHREPLTAVCDATILADDDPESKDSRPRVVAGTWGAEPRLVVWELPLDVAEKSDAAAAAAATAAAAAAAGKQGPNASGARDARPNTSHGRQRRNSSAEHAHARGRGGRPASATKRSVVRGEAQRYMSAMADRSGILERQREAAARQARQLGLRKSMRRVRHLVRHVDEAPTKAELRRQAALKRRKYEREVGAKERARRTPLMLLHEEPYSVRLGSTGGRAGQRRGSVLSADAVKHPVLHRWMKEVGGRATLRRMRHELLAKRPDHVKPLPTPSLSDDPRSGPPDTSIAAAVAQRRADEAEAERLHEMKRRALMTGGGITRGRRMKGLFQRKPAGGGMSNMQKLKALARVNTSVTLLAKEMGFDSAVQEEAEAKAAALRRRANMGKLRQAANMQGKLALMVRAAGGGGGGGAGQSLAQAAAKQQVELDAAATRHALEIRRTTPPRGLRSWDVVMWTKTGHTGGVLSLARTGDYLASGGPAADSPIHLWSIYGLQFLSRVGTVADLSDVSAMTATAGGGLAVASYLETDRPDLMLTLWDPVAAAGTGSRDRKDRIALHEMLPGRFPSPAAVLRGPLARNGGCSDVHGIAFTAGHLYAAHSDGTVSIWGHLPDSTLPTLCKRCDAFRPQLAFAKEQLALPEGSRTCRTCTSVRRRGALSHHAATTVQAQFLSSWSQRPLDASFSVGLATAEEVKTALDGPKATQMESAGKLLKQMSKKGLAV